MIAEVIVDISNSEVDKIFDYQCDDSLKEGHRVLVPFGKREIEGYVVAIKDTTDCPVEKLKSVIRPLDAEPVIIEEALNLMRFMKKRYHLRTVDALRLFLPAELRGGKVKELIKKIAYISPEFVGREIFSFIKPSAHAQVDAYNFVAESGEVSLTELNKVCSAAAVRNLIARNVILVRSQESKRTPYKQLFEEQKTVTLTPAQKNAVDAVRKQKNKTFLLHGVTGSGKTEVYLSVISEVINSGKTAIMLVPEISLTPQVLKNFRSRFGENVAILHSGLSAGERFDEWRRLLNGEATVAVGARSAVFAPLKNLGVIIVDEEHDSSYSSESNPRYFTHEVAEFRKRYNTDCSVILGSATPSVDSFRRALLGEYTLLSLPDRVNKRELPQIKVINMSEELYRGNSGLLSAEMESELHRCMEANEQAIIFINRRGYSSFLRCQKCGYVAKCERCDVSLVYHKEESGDVLKCHYCGNRYSLPTVCPECGASSMRRGYVGTQQVAELLQNLFPGKKVLRMDNDTTQGKDAHLDIITKFQKGEASILVGTQMIAKGHDFPNVTFVGIVDADMSLHFADFRSAERTYQLITQVSGRAGRDVKPGKVVLQTYAPNNYVYRYAIKGDYRGFYDKEINLREVTKFPPFSVIVRVLVSGEDENLAATALKNIFSAIKDLSEKHQDDFYYLSYMWSPVKKIKSHKRMQALMRLKPNCDGLIEKIYAIVDEHLDSRLNIFVELNPNNLG
ncbi:MAG: primosomal protein N' [Clostridia bacterium]|nr:primosomal protein N' [Clostridia bacterium]